MTDVKKVYSRKYPIIADLIMSDAHNGHKIALMYPYGLEDYSPNDMQKWLYKVYLEHFLPDIKYILKQAKPKYVHGLLGGDMGDIDAKNRSNHYWSKNVEVIKENSYNLLNPLMELMDSFHALKGTGSHTGGVIDEAIANNFDHCIKRNEWNSAWYRCEYELGGVLVDAQHKGKNKSKWAKTNLLNALRSEIILDRAQNNRRIPDISYRFHFHWSGTTDREENYRVVSVPSWQLPNDYIAEIDSVGRTAMVGGMVVLYQNGKVVDDFPLNYTYEEDKIWKPK